MEWEISGNYMSSCSCDVNCPCLVGETKADRGWCSGALCFDIEQGQVGDVDVSGARIAMVGDWPQSYVAGGGTARIYFDSELSDAQRNALAPIIMGQKGGSLENMSAIVQDWLPPKTAHIEVKTGEDEMRFLVEGFGEGKIVPIRGVNGEPTRILNASAGYRDDVSLGRGQGTQWSDPETRTWESGGHAEYHRFHWSA